MMTEMCPPPDCEWLTSVDARKAFRLTTCELAHLRESGQLEFRRKGNAFLYQVESLRAVTAGKLPESRTHSR
jgi:hypothetical protein